MIIDLAIDGRVFIESDLDAAVQELDLLFNTSNTELIGYPLFGTNFEQFLWQLNPAEESIKSYIKKKISDNTFFMKEMDYEISVVAQQGKMRDIYVVSIVIKDPVSGRIQKRTYQLR